MIKDLSLDKVLYYMRMNGYISGDDFFSIESLGINDRIQIIKDILEHETDIPEDIMSFINDYKNK